MKRKPSLVDVARQANVAVSTVSRTISGRGKIGAETQELIRRAMRELGYIPNRAARRLRSRDGSGGLVGLIIPNIQNSFFADLARGVEDECYARNAAVFFCNYDEDAAKQDLYLDILRSESVDGIIIPPRHENDPSLRQLALSGLPMVCVDRSLADCAIDKVEIDNRAGAFAAVRHLLDKGHRRIGIITGPNDTSTGRDRLLGYRDAHAACGVATEEELVKFGDFKEESGRRFALQLLSMPRPPSALFTCNNLMTIGALHVIAQLKVQIPGQLALIGFDDMMLADVFTPPLTMVDQPAYEVGQSAARLLFQRVSEPDRPAQSLVLSPRLILRQSA